jgi:nucleoid-associated protein YgaU
VRRLLGVSALALLFGLPLAGCSGQQQDEEGLEVDEQGENQAAEDNATGDVANEQPADNVEGENNTAEDNVANDEAPVNEEGIDTANAGDAGTENDLQEIIQEMNGQPTDGGAAQAAVPAPVDNTALAAPVAAPIATAEAAPAAPAQNTAVLPFQPGGTPAGNGLPELGSKMAYVVEHGDTLGKISSKIYGNPGRWNELATLSGITNPSRIFPGDLVYYTLDEGAVPFAAAYESIQKSEEQVQPGDTLATIAQRVYGTTTAWRSIWRQNDNIENPDIVPPGTTVVYIPKGAASTAANTKAPKTKFDLVKLAKATKSQLLNGNHANLQAATKQLKPTFVAKPIKIANVSVVPFLI